MIDAFETSGTSPSTGEHESAPLALIPTQFNRPLPGKPPAKRLFSGMAGSPLAVIGKPTQVEPCVPEDYETEITKALGRNNITIMRQTDVGKKDYEDLKHEIDIEVLHACRKYGDRMTPALAYKIARNRIARFTDERAKGPKFTSLDNKPEGEDGEELEASKAEIEILDTLDEDQSTRWGPDRWTEVNEEMKLLEKLISTYHGIKRQVAEVMLYDPDMTIRDIEKKLKVARTTIHRIVKAIRNDFRKLTRTPPNQVLARKFLGFLRDRGLTLDSILGFTVNKQQEIRTAFYLKTNELPTNRTLTL